MHAALVRADTWFPNGSVTHPVTSYEGNPNSGTYQPVLYSTPLTA
jgi:hypothetical protein